MGARKASVPSEIRRGKRIVRLSNLDKPYWPESGITKGDLLRYYRDVAPALLPHIRGRPFTMKRYPDGWRGRPFFRKDATSYVPAWVKRVPIRVTSRGPSRQSRMIEVPVANDELALLWMVNTGCIECHTWYSRIDKLEGPDWVVFDLDPSEDVGFVETVEVALLVKEALDVLGLASFPKTSGALGLHVLVPIERRHTYDDTRRFATQVARAIADAHADVATTEWSKAKRRGVLIDASQNAKGQDDRVRLLGAAHGERARLDAAPLERGNHEARSVDVHHGGSAAPARQPRRPLRGCVQDEAAPWPLSTSAHCPRELRPRPGQSKRGCAQGLVSCWSGRVAATVCAASSISL